jgi:hypothetical protein
LIIEEIRSLDIEQANLSTEANALEIELSRLTRPTQKNIAKFMKDALSTLKKDPQLIARNFIKRIIAGTSEVTFEFDLRHFAGVENLIFDIVIPIIVPRELIVKSKFLTWDYDFKKVNYRPKFESSRVKLQSDLNLIQS